MKQLHLVILPFSAHGHLIPALLLSNRLVKLGFKVTYVCFEYRFKQIQKEAIARGCNEQIQFKFLRTGSPTNGESGSGTGHDSFQILNWLCSPHNREFPDEFKQVMKELDCGESPAPSCIISDNLVASWAQIVANELRLPRIVLYPSPALALAVVFHLKQLLEQGKLPVKTSPEELLEVIQIPGMEACSLSPLLPKDVSTPIHDTSSKEMQDFYVENALRIHDAAGILCNTITELEPDACEALKENRELNPNKVPFLAAGPLLPDSYFQKPSSEISAGKEDNGELWLQWLDDQPANSVIYISFGSFAKATEEQVEELALGLEASGKRFLWILPEGNLPDGFLKRIGRRGMVLQKWIPQLRVLSHKAVGGFLSHCGWNSTMESVSRGVPMVAMPFFGEQEGNARIIVEYWGIGVRLVKDGVTGLIHRNVVEAAVRKVIDNGEELRRKAGDLERAAEAASRDSPAKTKAFIEDTVSSYRQAVNGSQ